MTAALTLGLLSALLYGTTDFVAGFASRAAGVVRTMFYGQAALMLLLGAWLFLAGPEIVADFETWAALAVSDVMILAATACLYRAVASGRLAVVAPIVASYGAVGALLAVAAGEQVAPLAIMGLSLVALGAAAAAAPGREDDEAVTRPSKAGTAAAAALLYGAGFWLQGRFAVPAFGPLATVWSYYAIGTVILAIAALSARRNLALPSASEAPKVFGTAALAFGGYAALAFGQSTGQVALVTALSAAASAVTVLLARAFLRERVSIVGWAGVISVVTGLAVLHTAQG